MTEKNWVHGNCDVQDLTPDQRIRPNFHFRGADGKLL
jgi:hypothetical protein